MAPIRGKTIPNKDVIGYKLDEHYMRTTFKQALEKLRTQQRKVMNSNLSNENPITKDGEISPDALMLESSLSS